MLNKAIKLSMALVILAGVVFGLVGFFSYLHYKSFQEDGVKISATITRIDAVPDAGDSGRYTHYVYVSYNIDGQEYTDVRINTYTSSMRVGKKITVYYLPDNPFKAEYLGLSWLFPLIFGGVGAVFFSIGAGVLIRLTVNDARRIRLRKNGTRIELTIEDIKVNTSVQVMALACPLRVICSDDEGNVFKSKSVFRDSNIFDIGDTITAYIDSKNSKKYYVDVDQYIRDKLS